MKIRPAKVTGKIIGAVRVSDEVYAKVHALAKKAGVSAQEIIRAILDEVIDEVEL